MEKDPDIVAHLARQRADENWRFRTFLKMASGGLVRGVNAVAGQAGEEAVKQMDCTSCAACCRDNWVPLSDEEIDRLARRLGLGVEAFRQGYLVKDDESDGWAIDARSCPFLDGHLCSVYTDRPGPCRGYPYIGGDVPSRMWGILERAETCPIVFEMLEQTKAAVGFYRFSPRPA